MTNNQETELLIEAADRMALQLAFHYQTQAKLCPGDATEYRFMMLRPTEYAIVCQGDNYTPPSMNGYLVSAGAGTANIVNHWQPNLSEGHVPDELIGPATEPPYWIAANAHPKTSWVVQLVLGRIADKMAAGR